MNRVTVFTPTYNRAYIIDRLIDSLLNQTNYSFSWLVIDDGSNDNTEEIFKEFEEKEIPFSFKYLKIDNGGKQRAINMAVSIIETEYVFIVDSDDFLVPDAIEKIIRWINDEEIDENFAGVSGVRGIDANTAIGNKTFCFDCGYVDATNLERKKYNLECDMAEIYKTEILRKHPFEVYENETFVPEAIVWDQIALEGYRLRWYQDIIYICEYLEDGLTNSSWALIKNNPVGYARMFNMKLKTNNDNKWKNCTQMVCYFILAHRWDMIFQSNAPIRAMICSPVAYMLSLRRRIQFKEYVK